MNRKLYSLFFIFFLGFILLYSFLSENSRSSANNFGDDYYNVPEKEKGSEYEIKAVYLYNFLLMADWPELDEEGGATGGEVGDLCIGILGEDPFGNSFKRVESKIAKPFDIKVNVKCFGPYSETDEFDKCRVLFICSSEKESISEILKELERSRVLTVSDTEDFLAAGGMINFVKVNDEIRWEINRKSLQKANIKLSSQLLRSAVEIIEPPEPENP